MIIFLRHNHSLHKSEVKILIYPRWEVLAQESLQESMFIKHPMSGTQAGRGQGGANPPHVREDPKLQKSKFLVWLCEDNAVKCVCVCVFSPSMKYSLNFVRTWLLLCKKYFSKGQVSVITWLPWWAILCIPERTLLESPHKQVNVWQNKCPANGSC